MVYFLTFVLFSMLISFSFLSFIGNKISLSIDLNFYEKTKASVQKSNLIILIGFSLFLFINLVFSPISTLSNGLFLNFVLTILVLVLILIQTYLSLKNSVEYKNSIFFFTLLLTVLFVYGSVAKFSTATQQKVDKVVNSFTTYNEELKKTLSTDTIKVDLTKKK